MRAAETSLLLLCLVVTSERPTSASNHFVAGLGVIGATRRDENYELATSISPHLGFLSGYAVFSVQRRLGRPVGAEVPSQRLAWFRRRGRIPGLHAAGPTQLRMTCGPVRFGLAAGFGLLRHPHSNSQPRFGNTRDRRLGPLSKWKLRARCGPPRRIGAEQLPFDRSRNLKPPERQVETISQSLRWASGYRGFLRRGPARSFYETTKRTTLTGMLLTHFRRRLPLARADRHAAVQMNLIRAVQSRRDFSFIWNALGFDSNPS